MAVCKTRKGRGFNPTPNIYLNATCLPAAIPAAALAAAVSTAATAAAAFLRPGFVHVHRAAVQFFSVQPGNGAIGFRIHAHFDEPEASGPPGFPIRDDVHTVDC